MIWLKSCPRCFGDLFEDPRVKGEVCCLQCGAAFNPAMRPWLEQQAFASEHAPKLERQSDARAWVSSPLPGWEPKGVPATNRT
jgi:hypothetical protein